MLRALIVLLLLVILIPTAVVLGLRSRAVRRVILDRVSAAIETTAGMQITARDFSLQLRTGVLEIDGLSVGLPGSESRPFLFVPRARATGGWHSLLGERLRLDSLTLEHPRLDLDAPRPRSSTDRSPSAASTGLDILNIDVVGGTIRLDEVPSRLEVWLDAWRADDLVVRGTYVSGLLDLDVTGQLRAENSCACWRN